MAADGAILALDGVVAGYGAITILRGTGFHVAPARMTTIIGPNGAGKSTVFKAVFGMIPVREGDIRFAGESIRGRRPRDLLARGLAYVPQGRNLFPELTVRANLELGGITLADRADLARRLEAVMDRFPVLRRKADRQASTLSGGEQKMLEVGRALLLEPRLLLVDEPSIGLAPKVVGEVFALLTALRDSGVAVLVVEQNARRALAVSDDALVLEQGRLVLADTADAVLADPRIGHIFLGGRLKDSA